MKILLLNSIGQNKWGGGEKWMILAAKGLIGNGHEVYIGCRKNSILQQKAVKANVPVLTFNIKSDFSFTGAYELYKYSRKKSFEIIVGCQNRDIRISGAIKKIIGSPKVISRQGVKLLNKTWKYRWFFSPFCDGIITNTYSIKEEYDAYNWWPEDYVKVIYNGVEINGKNNVVFDFNKYIPQTISNPKIILSAGRLSHQKGLNFLIDAAEQVCKTRDDIFFFIAGKGKLEGKLNKLIHARELQNRVFLIGFFNDLTSLFKQSDLFVLSSLYEGMPNVVMEAMAHHVPVISTDVNGVSELLINKESGIVIPPSDSYAISNSILEFFNEDKHTIIVENAYKRISELFTVEVMIKNLEEYFLSKIS